MVTEAIEVGQKRTVMLVDDHPVVRKGLAELIDAEPDLRVSAQTEDIPSTLAEISKHKPDIAVVDLSLRNGSGLDLIKDLKAQAPGVQILVLSMHEETLYAERCLRAGASGYIMKHEAAEKILDAIRKVLGGEVYLAQKISNTLVNRLVSTGGKPGQSTLERLTNRELEIFQMIGRGMPTRQIAEQLKLAVKTVEAHREHIKQKLGLTSSNELLRYAIQHSLG